MISSLGIELTGGLARPAGINHFLKCIGLFYTID
jgi:hypothetical protein